MRGFSLKKTFHSFPYDDDRLIYKMLARSCIFNDIKHDKKAFLCVTVLDFGKFWAGFLFLLGPLQRADT